MDAINAGAKAINDAIAYLKSNAWPIVIMLGLWFLVKPRGVLRMSCRKSVVILFSQFSFSFFAVLEAMDDIQTRRSPQTVEKYDNDLRRVRAMQQLQAEQDAKAKAKALKEKKAEQPAPEKKEPKPVTTTKPPSSSLNMNNFSTPSYRYVFCVLRMSFSNIDMEF